MHLIVTVTFAVLELLTVCACVIVGALDSTFSFPLLILALLILVLLIPYIKHYYLLENEVQKMYVQYDRIVQKMYEEEKMSDVRVIKLNESVYSHNDNQAEETRRMLMIRMYSSLILCHRQEAERLLCYQDLSI